LDDCLGGRSLPDFVVAKMTWRLRKPDPRSATSLLASGRIAVWLFERNEAALQKHGGSGEKLLATFCKHGYSIHYWMRAQRWEKRG